MSSDAREAGGVGPSERGRSRAGAEGDRGPVLVVEDDADIRDSLAEVLGAEGRPVASARNGAEALDLLRSGARRPCLILLDIMMPVMDGWAFHAALAGDAALASIPIVVLSGDARATERAASLGCAGALGKPASVEDVLRAVRRFG